MYYSVLFDKLYSALLEAEVISSGNLKIDDDLGF